MPFDNSGLSALSGTPINQPETENSVQGSSEGYPRIPAQPVPPQQPQSGGSVWRSVVQGALIGLSNSGGATSFGSGLGAGAQGVIKHQQQQQANEQQALRDEAEIRFRDAYSAKMTADASLLNQQITQMPEELKLRVEQGQLKIADFLRESGIPPTLVIDDEPAAATAALAHFTKTHDGIPPAHVLHVGGKLAIYASPMQEDTATLEYVNKVRSIQGLPKMSDAAWKDPKQRENAVMDAHSLFFPANLTEANAETEYYRRKMIRDNFDRTYKGDPSEKQSILSALDASTQMIRDVQRGNLQRTLTVTKAQTEARRKPEDPDELSPTKLNKVTALASQFDSNPIVKAFNVQVNKAESVKNILEAGLGGPGDLAIVYEFMKGLDETSVVRESEYAAASKSGNIFAGAMARFNGYLKEDGGMLPQNVKESFLKIVTQKMGVTKKQVSKMHADFARRIEKITGKANGGEYLTDYANLYADSDEPTVKHGGQPVYDPSGKLAGYSYDGGKTMVPANE
jgi:flagellar hook-basal body complex protein FliE